MELVGERGGRVEDEAVGAVDDELGEAVEADGADGEAAAVHVEHLHREVEPRRRRVQADAEVGGAEEPRVVCRVEPHRAHGDVAERHRPHPRLVRRLQRPLPRHDGDDAQRRRGVGRRRLGLCQLAVERRQRLQQHPKVLVGAPARRAHEQRGAAVARPPVGRRPRRRAARPRPDAVGGGGVAPEVRAVVGGDEEGREAAEEVVALRRRQRREEGGRPVVEHARVDAPLVAQPRLHRRRHAQVAVEAAREELLVRFRERDEGVALAQPVLQHGVREVVPVEPDDGAPEHPHRPRREQRGDRRRRLHEQHVGLREDDEQRPQQLAELEQRLEREVQHQQEARRRPREHVRPHQHRADARARLDRRHAALARVPHEPHLGARLGERERVVLHPRRAADVAEDEDRGGARRGRGRHFASASAVCAAGCCVFFTRM